MDEFISRSALIQSIDSASDDLTERLKEVFIEIVADQPVAYNVDKVVEQVFEAEEVKNHEPSEEVCRQKMHNEDCDNKTCNECLVGRIVELIKAGGVNE